MFIGRYKSSNDDKIAMPPGIPYIIGNEIAVRFSESGMSSILFIFISKYLLDDMGLPQLTEAQSMVWYHNFVSASWFFAVIGAVTADIFFGKYKTIVISSAIYCFGYLILAFFNTKSGLICGLTMVAIGVGGINPCVTAHVGDQFNRNNRRLINKIYSWFYFAINFGGLVAILLIPHLLEKYNPKIAFLVPGVLMLIATIIFYQGRQVFITIPPIGWRNYFKELQNKDNKQAIYNLLIIFVFIAFFFALHGQYSSSWVVQAGKMNREIDFGFFKFSLGQSQIQVLNPIFVIILMPVFSYIICPLFDKYLHMPQLKKIAAGFFLAGASFIIIAAAQRLIEQGKEVGIVWQIWAFFLLTSGEIFIAITSFELSYLNAPNSMKSLSISLLMFAVSIGNKLTSEFNSIMQDRYGNLNILNSYYFMYFAAAIILVGILFIIYMPYYKGKVYLQKMKTYLPNRSIDHYSKIKQINDVILKVGNKKIAFILLFGAVVRRGQEKAFDEKEEMTDGYINNYNFLIVTKFRKHANPNKSSELEKEIRKKLVSKGIELKTQIFKVPELRKSVIGDSVSNKIIIKIESIDQFNLRSESTRLFKEGILLYNANKIKLLEPKQITNDRRKEIARKSYKHWYNQGLDFIKSYEMLRNVISNNLLVLYLHQAAESFYNCSLMVLTGNKPHCHELERLNYLLCKESNRFLDVFSTSSKEEKECFKLLEDGYINSRYNPDYLVSNKQLEYLFEKVENLKEITKEVCDKEIAFLELQS
jgi:POT family proton-dependent oligopeptide transporter